MLKRLCVVLTVGLLVSAGLGCSGATDVKDAPYQYLADARDIDVFFGLLEAAKEESGAALSIKDGVRASCHARPLNETKADYLKHLRRSDAYQKRAAELALVMIESDDPYFADMFSENRPVDRLGGLTLSEKLTLLPMEIGAAEAWRIEVLNMTIPEWQMWMC